MATSGRCGPTSNGSPSATTSGIALRSSRWRHLSSSRSPRPSRRNDGLRGRKTFGPRLVRGLHTFEARGSVMSEKFDVVILGGGNAGIGVTGPVRRAGMSVAMIEARDLGGTCPNRGCTPKKILVAAGHALHEIERASVHHIKVG